MKVLYLAPHPFYQDRGSPIAVDLMLRALSKQEYQVDVVTYHEGSDIDYENITLFRIPSIAFIKNIQVGFSWKKIICDLLMFFYIIPLAYKKDYQLVHAVEESVFMALLLKVIFRIPYVYDMDSSLAQQMVEQMPRLAVLSPVLNLFEGLAVRHANAVIPVCDALADDITQYNPKKLTVLQDVSLLSEATSQLQVNLKDQLDIHGLIFMYVGNLQTYQGIDLLLKSFALALEQINQAHLIIIGGSVTDIEKYQAMVQHTKIAPSIHFLGPKPLGLLASYLSQADILVSPRVTGRNTPMKIYSYLDSGKPVLATHLPTHTQILNDRVAMLADPTPSAFADKMVCLAKNETCRRSLGSAGKKLVAQDYSFEAFSRKLGRFYDSLRVEINQRQRTTLERMWTRLRKSDLQL